MVGRTGTGSSAGRVRHGLSDGFLDALVALAAEPGWWRDVLSEPRLFVAIRNESLNVYHRGASVFRVGFVGGRIVPETHVKYLVRQQQAYAGLGPDGLFSKRPEEIVWSGYEGKKTLAGMMRAAADLAGPEKIGVHKLVSQTLEVVDVEIALAAIADPAQATADEPGSEPVNRKLDRLDIATLEEAGGVTRLVFHEAKHFTNPELRASPGRQPSIVDQVERYRRSLAHHAEAIGAGYVGVCRALLRIDEMRRTVLPDAMPVHRLVRKLAVEGIPPVVDPEPRLIVFGFDRDQRDGPTWQAHQRRLTAAPPDGFGLRGSGGRRHLDPALRVTPGNKAWRAPNPCRPPLPRIPPVPMRTALAALVAACLVAQSADAQTTDAKSSPGPQARPPAGSPGSIYPDDLLKLKDDVDIQVQTNSIIDTEGVGTMKEFRRAVSRRVGSPCTSTVSPNGYFIFDCPSPPMPRLKPTSLVLFGFIFPRGRAPFTLMSVIIVAALVNGELQKPKEFAESLAHSLADELEGR